MINKEQFTFVYKTNIQNENDHFKIKNILGAHQLVEEWSVDTEDKDCVLRVVSDKISEQEIKETIHRIGFQCTELI